jgi:ATP-dependent DNA helicase RecG
MNTTRQEIESWMTRAESEHVEFKEARNQYDGDDLLKYCVALANEGGGKLVLGIDDGHPRKVVGSRAFPDLGKIKTWILDSLRIRVDAEELSLPEGRVVVFTVPGRPTGRPMHHDGRYWMRVGSSLRPMTPERLQAIFAEAEPDFSAQICPQASLAELDSGAIARLRELWARRLGNASLRPLSDAQLLEDVELVVDGRITYAALILLGTAQVLNRHLAQAEIIFEYRSSETAGPPQQRVEYREGFLLFFDRLWDIINTRNDVQHFQQGFFMIDIPTFSEVIVRESILNAVAHRDYRAGGSTFVSQFPRRLEVVSPGGLPPGITMDNMLWRQNPRNRRIAEVLARCGFVERSGQGVNLMFQESIKHSKPLPDYRGSDDFQVSVVFQGSVQDPMFVSFLEQIGHERLATYATEDFLLLDAIRREERIPESLSPRVPNLVDQGIIERIGRGRGTRYVLARRFYRFLGESGVYTRRRGLDRETNKQLLLAHLRDTHRVGSPLRELCQVLPALSRGQVQTLLRELKAEGLVHSVGRTRAARWFPGPRGQKDRAD